MTAKQNSSRVLNYFILLCALIIAVALLAGCQNKKVTQQTDGTIITETTDPWLSNKAVAGAGSVQAVKIETTGSTSSGTLLPNAVVGSGDSAGYTCPVDANVRVIAFSKSSGILNSLTNSSASGVSWTYQSTDGESAAETAQVVAQMVKFTTSSSSSDTSDSSDTSTVSTVYRPRLSQGPASARRAAAKPADQTISATVVAVHDGDGTVKCACADGITRSVRLYGIDAPELKQAHGPESRAALVKMILNKTVTLTIPAWSNDAHGRTVAKLTVDGTDVNLALVKHGFAWAYSAYLKASDKPAYFAAQNAAKTAKLGLWSQPNPTAPWVWRKAQGK
jgi:endonuclease YncB( thermonuclease family)